MRARMLPAFVLLAIAPVARAARADAPCTASVDDWDAQAGSIAPTGRCGAYLITAAPLAPTFSYGNFVYRRSVRVPYTVEVTWRRLGPESTSALELRLLGAIVLLKQEAYGLWAYDESSFAWRPLPGHRAHDPHTVRVEQTADRVALVVDGKRIDEWRFAATSREGRIGIGMKAAAGYRSLAAFEGFRVASQ